MRKMAKKNLIKVKGKNWKRGGRMSRKVWWLCIEAISASVFILFVLFF